MSNEYWPKEEDKFGRRWPDVPNHERCPDCGQPDNCGDCTCEPLTVSQAIELGAKVTEMVFTLVYTHKHGSDVGVYKTREGAEDAAYGLALERAEEWDDEEDTARFKAEDRDGAFDIFQEVEGEMAYGEILEINETELYS
jgi:hypothetical protein